MFARKCYRANFDLAPYVVSTSTHLRFAWPALPWEDTGPDGVWQFIKANIAMTEEERQRVPQNSDQRTLQTPWRHSIYYLWNHVFFDITKFLRDFDYPVGHFHPPSHHTFTLGFAGFDGQLASGRMSWDTDVLLIPAHRSPGVSVRATVNEVNEDGIREEELGEFNALSSSEIWYITKGAFVNFYVGSRYDSDPRDVAAVMICGIMCSDVHEP